MDALKRFESFVSPEPNSGCWLWMGAYNDHKRYGRFSLDGIPTMAHRASYELFRGPIPQGLEVDHLCRMPCCVNPEHLEAVTPLVNNQRQGMTKRAISKCPHGHEYDALNTAYYSNGHRRCRACHRIRQREAFRRRKSNMGG